MALPRYTSTMLARVAVASLEQAISTRAFSSALPLRMARSKPLYSQSSPRPVRVNPLVGNYVQPEEVQPTDYPPSASTEPSSSSRAPSPPTAPQSSAKAPFNEELSPIEDNPSKKNTYTNQHMTSNDDVSPSEDMSLNDDIPPPPPPPASKPTETTEQPYSPYTYNAADSRSVIDIANIISEKSAAYGRAHGVSNPLERPNVRTKAVVGRTVFIKDKLTPQSAPTPMVALRILERMCRNQKIKNKFHSQKFHERKGLKKKRLRSQRWRARFKKGFEAAVTRVMELKKQGW